MDLVNGKLINFRRVFLRSLNKKNLFLELRTKPYPIAIVAGYTRSGKSTLSESVSALLKARCIREPLNPRFSPDVSFFHERESPDRIHTDKKYHQALMKVFRPGYRGTERDVGSGLLYMGNRIVELARANFYLDLIKDELPETKIIFLVRNPLACILGRIERNWNAPDYSHCIADILPQLSEKQKEVYDNADSLHKRLAVSWCLDNRIALKNVGKPGFIFLFAEEIDFSLEFYTNLLKFMETALPFHRLAREVGFQRRKDQQSIVKPIDYYYTKLGMKETGEISEIIEVFGLSGLYNWKDGNPKDFQHMIHKPTYLNRI